MTVPAKQAPNDAIQSALGAIRSAPSFSSSTVGTTPTVPIVDASSSHGTRRVRLVNKHSSNWLGLALVAQGADYSACTLANSFQVPPGQPFEILVGANLRVVLIASAASTDYSLGIHDLG